MFQKVSKA